MRKTVQGMYTKPRIADHNATIMDVVFAGANTKKAREARKRKLEAI